MLSAALFRGLRNSAVVANGVNRNLGVVLTRGIFGRTATASAEPKNETETQPKEKVTKKVKETSAKETTASSMPEETSKQGEPEIKISEENQLMKEQEEKIAHLNHSYLTALAEVENVRTRAKRDIQNASQYAITKFCQDIISVGDILEMALKQCTSVANPDTTTVEGIKMTLDELWKVFRTHGVQPIDPMHQPFDPNLHMAMAEVPKAMAGPEAAALEPGTIFTVMKKGYTLHGRVIRPAQVGVIGAAA